MEYLQHFGLKNPPFHKGAEQLWNTEDLSVLASKFQRLLQTPGIGVLVGDYGLGKTAALRELIRTENKNQYHFSYTADTHYGRNEFYRVMARELGVELAHKRSDLWSNIREHLRAQKYDRKVTPVFIIDEAHQLHKDFLVDLSSFLNFNRDSEDLMTLWLVGHPELMHMLRNPKLGAIRSRIRIVHEMKALQDLKAFKEFLQYGFEAEGMPKLPIAEAGVKTIYGCSGGVPRKVHNIIVNALEIAYKNNESVLSDEILEEAIMQMP